MSGDPVEKIIEGALRKRGIRYEIGQETYALDFYVPDLDVYIECKQFHTDRIAKQTARHPNIIVVQGVKAAQAFSKWLDVL